MKSGRWSRVDGKKKGNRKARKRRDGWEGKDREVRIK